MSADPRFPLGKPLPREPFPRARRRADPPPSSNPNIVVGPDGRWSNNQPDPEPAPRPCFFCKNPRGLKCLMCR